MLFVLEVPFQFIMMQANYHYQTLFLIYCATVENANDTSYLNEQTQHQNLEN